MIQFTLGCILLALTLFFGGKEIMANQDMIENRNRSVNNQEDKVTRAANVKQRFDEIKEDAILFSDETKTNLLNQLNIDENKYKFDLTEPTQKEKALTEYGFKIIGFDEFSSVFNLVSDIEKIKGLELADVCFNCDVDDDSLTQRESEIGFRIEGTAYVYTPEK
tara:strand:+ start:2028 stop:2519 length:492 start_codon:yes stop_codon:yes gene_type:complete